MSAEENANFEEALTLVADWIHESQNIVAFTGAGVSTESGIPDFRSPGGIWERYDPEQMTYQRFLASEEARKMRWRMFMEMESMGQAKPNPAHYALADLYELGKLKAVITQNIDGLHQDAGVPADKVVEIHGTAREVYCLSCDRRLPSTEIRQRIADEGIEVPYCTECGGILKLATISFGQAMPEKEMREAERLSREADLMPAIGSTLLVRPAALMPMIAKEAGARVIIINLSETGGDYYADMVVRGKAGAAMSAIVKRYKDKYLA